MISRLGAVYQQSIGPNSSIWDILSHPLDALTYTGEAISSTVEGIGQPDIKSSLPNPIVASQGSPYTYPEYTQAGGWTPEKAASTGLAQEQVANTQMLANYEASLNNSIPWMTIGIVVGLGVLTLLVVKK